MRNAGRYRQMNRVYTIAEQMERMCKDMQSSTLPSDGALRDIIEAIKGRLYLIMSTANQASMDEYDFGPQGMMFEYTLKNKLKEALEEMGIKAPNKDNVTNDPNS